MRFWDSSAVVQLLCPQAKSPGLLALQRSDPDMSVWAWTPVECVSALRRLRREGRLSERGFLDARARLDELRDIWDTVDELNAVSDRAERCLLAHPLRAADAGQLGAALLLSERLGRHIAFVTLDRRLAEAARREALEVIGDDLVPVAHERRPKARGARK